MARHVYVYCSNCKHGLDFGRFSFARSPYHFGPQLVKCPRCHYLYQDHNAVELATKTDDKVKEYCKEYCRDAGNIFTFFGGLGIFYLIGLLFGINKIEDFVNTSYIGLLVFALCFVLAFFVKYFIFRLFFYRVIYVESVKRMRDSIYLGKIKAHNDYLNNRIKDDE